MEARTGHTTGPTHASKKWQDSDSGALDYHQPVVSYLKTRSGT